MVIHQIFPQKLPFKLQFVLLSCGRGRGGEGRCRRGNHLAEKELVRFPVKRDASRERGERHHTRRIIINDYFDLSVINGDKNTREHRANFPESDSTKCYQ